MDRKDFRRAVTELNAAAREGADLSRPFVSAIRVTGAAVTTLGDPLGTQTVFASDEVAAKIDEIQADLGEGPAWDAYATGTPQLEPDLQFSAAVGWPLARVALRETGVGAVHAFPLVIGAMRIGSVGLYTQAAGALTVPQISDASALASIAARHVLQRSFREVTEGGPEMRGGEYSRREVHQASGMVSAQLDIGVDDALVLLRAYAFGNGMSLRDAARDVVERRLDFAETRSEDGF